MREKLQLLQKIKENKIKDLIYKEQLVCLFKLYEEKRDRTGAICGGNSR